MPATTASYPKKLFYKINEVADIVGVEAYVLRYWETKFPMLKPERYGNDERRYRSRDIDLLLRIRHLLYEEKYTIAGAVERIRKDPRGKLELEEVPAEELPSGNGSEETAMENSQLQLFADEAADVMSRLRTELADIRSELIALRQQAKLES